MVETAICVGGPLDRQEVLLPFRSTLYWTDGERLIANTASTPPDDILASRGFYQRYAKGKNIMLQWKEVKP